MINIPFADAEPKVVPIDRRKNRFCIERIIEKVKVRSDGQMLIEIEPSVFINYNPATDKWIDHRKDAKGRICMGKTIRGMLRHLGVQAWIEAYEQDPHASEHAEVFEETPLFTEIHEDTLRFSFNGRVQEWRVSTNLTPVMIRRVFNRYFVRKPGGSLKLKRFCRYAESLDAAIICSQLTGEEVSV